VGPGKYAECSNASVLVAVLLACLQAFTGKPARGMHNTPSKLLHEVQNQLPTTAYGLVNGRGFYCAAAEAGLKECCLQLCGQGYPLCRTGPAAAIVQQLLAEADQAAQQLCAPDRPM
jgi:nitronate monooxygenase